MVDAEVDEGLLVGPEGDEVGLADVLVGDEDGASLGEQVPHAGVDDGLGAVVPVGQVVGGEGAVEIELEVDAFEGEEVVSAGGGGAAGEGGAGAVLAGYFLGGEGGASPDGDGDIGEPVGVAEVGGGEEVAVLGDGEVLRVADLAEPERRERLDEPAAGVDALEEVGGVGEVAGEVVDGDGAVGAVDGGALPRAAGGEGDGGEVPAAVEVGDGDGGGELVAGSSGVRWLSPAPSMSQPRP